MSFASCTHYQPCLLPLTNQMTTWSKVISYHLTPQILLGSRPTEFTCVDIMPTVFTLQTFNKYLLLLSAGDIWWDCWPKGEVLPLPEHIHPASILPGPLGARFPLLILWWRKEGRGSKYAKLLSYNKGYTSPSKILCGIEKRQEMETRDNLGGGLKEIPFWGSIREVGVFLGPQYPRLMGQNVPHLSQEYGKMRA